MDRPARLSLAAQLLFSTILAAFICGGFYYFWYSDAVKRETLKRERLEHQRLLLSSLELLPTRYLPAFQRQVAHLEENVNYIKQRMAARFDRCPHAGQPGQGTTEPDSRSVPPPIQK